MSAVVCPCSEDRPHGAHFYVSFIAGGPPGPMSSLNCLCPGRKPVTANKQNDARMVGRLAEAECHIAQLTSALHRAEVKVERAEALVDEWVAIARESRPHLGCLDMHRHLAGELRAALDRPIPPGSFDVS